MDFEDFTADTTNKLSIDDDLFGDQDFDLDELDADGFSARRLGRPFHRTRFLTQVKTWLS
jgi:hypothetical protein